MGVREEFATQLTDRQGWDVGQERADIANRFRRPWIAERQIQDHTGSTLDRIIRTTAMQRPRIKQRGIARL